MVAVGCEVEGLGVRCAARVNGYQVGSGIVWRRGESGKLGKINKGRPAGSSYLAGSEVMFM
jgi:hypothetical protein